METKAPPTRGEQLAVMFQNLRVFLYDKEKGEVMGRNAESWAKLSLFFLVYYACLAAFFAAMFAIAFSTMPEKKEGPKYTSIIADKPLLLVYPEGGVGSYAENDIPGIAGNYENFLKAYKEQYVDCYDKDPCKPGESYRPPDKDKQCYFTISDLGPCAPVMNSTFGYKDKTPCLYLRLTKIYEWKPVPHNSGKFVKLHCDAEGGTPVSITYYPEKDKAFPISFWPFRGESHFMTPIAAIQVNTTADVDIRCKALADNIELSSTWKLKRGATGKLEFNVSPAKF